MIAVRSPNDFRQLLSTIMSNKTKFLKILSKIPKLLYTNDLMVSSIFGVIMRMDRLETVQL
jgi:hypothetical protein